MGFLQQNFSNHLEDSTLAVIEANRIAQLIVANSVPDKIILIGSAVDGTFRKFSDLDFVLIYEDGTKIISARSQLSAARISPKWPCDYIFATVERFESMKDLGGPLYMAHNFGKILYDKRTAI